MVRNTIAALAAVLACLCWTSAARGATARRGRLPEGHAGRQHAEPDGAGRRPRRARLLHRARRAPDDLEAQHAADGHGGHGPGDAQPGERPARPPARPGLRHQQLGLPLLLAAAGQLEHAGDRPLQGQRRHARPGVRAEDPHVHPPARAVLPLRRLDVLRARRQPLRRDGRQHEPVRLGRLQPDRRAHRPFRVGRAAHVGQHERPQRQDPAHQAGREPDRRARRWATRTRSRPATCSRRAPRRRGPRSSRMGFRNPFRITVDQETGWVLSADYGPDAGTANANRGPQGSVEYNVVPQAGNYGWPYCVRDNVQYNDYNFETSTSGAEVRLREPQERVAQQHGPDGPSARAARVGVDGLQRHRPALPPEPRHRRRADGRPALPLRPEPRLRAQVPGVLRRQVVHRRVEQRLDQDRRTSARRAR